MTVWKIEIFDSKDDIEPSRVGYVEAASDSEAGQIAASAMGFAELANIDPAPRVTKIPSREIIWVTQHA